jgi:hypothetical protein
MLAPMRRLWFLVKLALATVAVVWLLSLPFGVEWPQWATGVFGLVTVLAAVAMYRDTRTLRAKQEEGGAISGPPPPPSPPGGPSPG